MNDHEQRDQGSAGCLIGVIVGAVGAICVLAICGGLYVLKMLVEAYG